MVHIDFFCFFVCSVEKYLSSEVPIFFELRVRYLLTCSRTQEAVALAKCCLEHPELGKHLYFHQAYFTCLWKASRYDHLQKGVRYDMLWCWCFGGNICVKESRYNYVGYIEFLQRGRIPCSLILWEDPPN